MADTNNKENENKFAERKISGSEQSTRFENAKKNEIGEVPKKDERMIDAELRREIEMMEVDEATKKDAEIESEKISYLGQKEKIEHLLKVAREKGLVYAIQVARKMGDPSILDILHDTLAKEGFYKDFVK